MKELSLVRIERDKLRALIPSMVVEAPKVDFNLGDNFVCKKSVFCAWPKRHLTNASSEMNDPLPPLARSVSVKIHEGGISRLALSSSGVLASGSDDCSVKLFLENGSSPQTLSGHCAFVSGLAFHPTDSRLLLSSAGDGEIRVWNSTNVSAILHEHSTVVWTIDIHPSGSYAVTASMDHSLKLIDLVSLKSRLALRGHFDSVNCGVFGDHLAANIDSNVVLSGSADKSVSLWDVRSRQRIQTLAGHTNSVNTVAVQAGPIFATGDADGTVKFWDSRNLRFALDGISVGSSNVVHSARFHPTNPSLLAVATSDGNLRIVSVEGPSILQTIGAGEGEILDCVWKTGREIFIADTQGCLTTLCPICAQEEVSMPIPDTANL